MEAEADSVDATLDAAVQRLEFPGRNLAFGKPLPAGCDDGMTLTEQRNRRYSRKIDTESR